MAATFASCLTRLRKGAGFKSPYQFWSKNGGNKFLKLSSVNYWKIERGMLLPKPERLPSIISCLRLQPETPEIRKLLELYLKELLKSEDVFRWMRGLLSERPGEPKAHMGQQAIDQLLRGRTYHLTPAQMEAVTSSYAGYWTYEFLANEKKSWETAKLAEVLDIKTSELEKGLNTLEKAKLVQILPSGLVRFAHIGKQCVAPPYRAMREAVKDNIRQYHERMLKSKGMRTYHCYTILKASEAQLQGFYPYLRETATNAEVFTTYDSPPDGALFLVEGAVHRLFPC